MRVGQLLRSASHQGSGIFEFTCGLSRTLVEAGVESRVFGIEDSDTWNDAHRWHPVTPQVGRGVGPRVLGLAPGLLPALLKAELDVLHAHGLWTLLSPLTLAWAARRRRPFLVSVHGMLNPRAVAHSRLRKRIAAALYEKRRLRTAGCLHSVGDFETRAIRSYGVSAPVCEIPYGVEIPDDAAAASAPAPAGGSDPGPPAVLYIGRFDPLKGLDDLIAGWGQARREQPELARPWRLVLAGWGKCEYEQRLRGAASTTVHDGSIVFPGVLVGAERESAYRSAAACILPSLSEGQPLAVLEAWARRRPVLMTEACNLQTAFAAGAALRIGSGSAGVASALLELFSMRDSEREQMGRNGRALVEGRFSWEVVGRQFREAYAWLAGGGGPPACLR